MKKSYRCTTDRLIEWVQTAETELNQNACQRGRRMDEAMERK
jgi:hypothetical protein